MKRLLITEAERLAICEAANILRRIAKGQEVTSEDAKEACQDILAINYVVADETWKDEAKWP